MNVYRFTTLATVITACSILFCGCSMFGLATVNGNGNVQSAEKELPTSLTSVRVEHFNMFPSVGGIIRVVMHASDTPKVVVTADNNILAETDISVVGNSLTVSGRKGHLYHTDKIRIDVYGNNYNDLALALASRVDLTTDGPLTAKTLAIHASGSVTGGGEIAVESGRLVVSGSADLVLTGSAKSLDYLISGSGKIDSSSILADDVSANISGSGTANMHAQKSVKCTISGSGTLILAGSADTLDVNIGGSGKLEAAELAAKNAKLTIAGSGRGTINVSDNLDISVSGSGNIRYTGRPKITQRVSGSGRIENVE